MKILIDLFLVYFKIGIFSFGGGYAILAFMEHEIIDVQGWLTVNEFIDVVAISQMTPGPIAVNAATYVGYKTAGVMGALFATVGVISVSMILILTAAKLLEKNKNSEFIKGMFRGLRPAVMGLISVAAYSVGKTAIVDGKTIIIAIVTVIVAYKTKVHPIIMILMAGCCGLVFWG